MCAHEHVCGLLCRTGFHKAAVSGTAVPPPWGTLGTSPPITTPLKQSQMQAEDPSPKHGTVSSELFRGTSTDCPYLGDRLKSLVSTS